MSLLLGLQAARAVCSPVQAVCSPVRAVCALHNLILTGLLTAFLLGTWVFVHSGTCVVVFSHPIGKPEYKYILDYM
ncbi:hypothetical protein PCANC_12589 [Puccinia coronata f. sp. avenae]|uniref:Uncharacterized protein n=1 Tax=Puccinia coronata f. sp. avenae TaxID=200324 RepID=A0A2N5SNP7_9BASI|nr:hypothetical protein PCASD_15816 [Puccinia coronata f. sp. avenae]PLW39136.1 hypothetical protein PCANC_12589 [Puccinia coronata f. sp. avenae]